MNVMYITSSRGLGYEVDISPIRIFVVQPKYLKISNPFANKMKKKRDVYHELWTVMIRDRYLDHPNTHHHPKIYPTYSNHFDFWILPLKRI